MMPTAPRPALAPCWSTSASARCSLSLSLSSSSSLFLFFSLSLPLSLFPSISLYPSLCVPVYLYCTHTNTRAYILSHTGASGTANESIIRRLAGARGAGGRLVCPPRYAPAGTHSEKSTRRKKVGTLAQCLQVGTLAQCLLHLSAMPAPCACQQRAVQRRKRKEEKKAVQNGSIGLCCTARLRGL